MWIRLNSYKENNPLLVSGELVTHIAARLGGGSTLYFALATTDGKKGETKQRALAVRESIDEIARQFNGATPNIRAA
jgi:hypothetical protein